MLGAPVVTFTVPDVAPVSAPALNASVRGPTVPVIVRLVNAASPFWSVTTVSVPPSVPPPEAIEAVTGVPLTVTA